MNSVTISLKKDSTAKMDFIAWKNDRQAFYARPPTGKPRVVTLTPAMPKGAVWTVEPFPECAPIKIEPFRLLPPPCQSSEDECGTRVPEPWEYVYLKTHNQILYPSREDDKPLRQLLAEYKKAKRIEYEREKVEAAQIESTEKREDQLEKIEHRYHEPLHKWHGRELAGALNITLDMVKRGCGDVPGQLPGRECIRDAYLVKSWAEREGIDLARLDKQRGDFFTRIKERTGLLEIVHDMVMKEKRRKLVAPGFYGEHDPMFMALCASVQHRVEFQNGDAACLTRCETRSELRAEEWRELKRDHGLETAKERKEKANRREGGRTSANSLFSPKIVTAAVKKYTELLRQHPGSKIQAARRAAEFIEREYGDKPTPKTIQNWSTKKTRSGRKKTL